jgi:hypothetical protein
VASNASDASGSTTSAKGTQKAGMTISYTQALQAVQTRTAGSTDMQCGRQSTPKTKVLQQRKVRRNATNNGTTLALKATNATRSCRGCWTTMHLQQAAAFTQQE